MPVLQMERLLRMKLFRKPAIAALLAALVLLWAGCDRAMVYDQSVPVKGRSWHRAVQYPFLVTIEDTVSVYNLYVNLRHTGDYPYSNLFLFLHSSLPDGQLATDTLELVLADSRGRWYGEGLGDLLSYRILYKKGVRLAQSGVYRFSIEQAMRSEALPAIVNVGFRVERAETIEEKGVEQK